MAQHLPSDASADAIEEELTFLDVLISSLDQESVDYEKELAKLEEQKAKYEKRLDTLSGAADFTSPPMNMGLDGSSDWWETTMGSRPGGADREFTESMSSPYGQQNGLKRPLNGVGSQYPSKRPTPDPSAAGTPTSSTGSFEWIDHPQKPSISSQQSAQEKARQRQLQVEAALKRQRELEFKDAQYARLLSQAQNQSRSASFSSSRPNTVQTTLNPGGSFSRPKPTPTPVLSPPQEQQLQEVGGHAHPTPRVKPESTSSKAPPYSSPLTSRTKAPTAVVDLTGDSDDDEDLAEVAPTAFSPNNRRRQLPTPTNYHNRPPFDPNNAGPAQIRAPAVQPIRQPMPGSWPTAMQVPSNDNGYVYQQQNRPEWLRNSNSLPFSQAVSTAHNGLRTLGNGFGDTVAEIGGLIGGTGSRTSNVYGANSLGSNPYGWNSGSGTARNGTAFPGAGFGNSTPLGGPSNGATPRGGNFFGGNGNGGAFNNTYPSDQEDDDDDEVIFSGARQLAPGQGLHPPGYANQEDYRRRFDEMMNQNPQKTMEEINALMENIRPDEDTPSHLRVKTPEELSVLLHKYQELGLTWLQRCEDGKSKGGILADDMGLGKTIQMLSLIVTHKSEDVRCKTTLIVAPVALMRQWKQEIESKLKPRHRLSVYVHHGPSRKKYFHQLQHFDVVLTTFGTLTAELKKLEAFSLRKKYDPAARPRPTEQCALLGDDAKWYRVVLDEAQCIKNNNTQGAKAACRLQTTYRFCMTGTPMMNNVDELWSLIHFLRIKPYCERTLFQRDFTKRLKSEYSRAEAMKHLQAVIRSIMLRRTKQSKFEGKPILILPERTTLVDHPVFSEDEKAFYDALENKTQLTFNKYLNNGTVGSSYSAILVLLLRLRQACCHPHLIKDFGVSQAAGVSPETLIELAKNLDPVVVERIKATNGNFECPVCYDACPNPAIFVPCGHDTCQECFTKIADTAARNGEGGGAGASNAKCPNCRGDINSKNITDFESFKKIHMPDHLSEEEKAELEQMYAKYQVSDSKSDDEDEDEDSETESGDEDEVNSNGDLDDFVVKDEDSETASEAEEMKAEDENEADVVGPPAQAAARKEKGKGKAPARSAKKGMKGKKTKGKKKEKKAKQAKKKPAVTIAELRRLANRSAKGRRAYIKKLNEDWITSAKIEKTMETLKEIMENPEGEKVLVFSQWTSLLDLLECPIYREGWGYRRYDGSMNASMRGDAVDDFRDTSKDVRIMLVSLKAGNAGLNLNMASQVIILDPFWNPYIEEQAIDRAHRIGQGRPVTVHRMLIQETVEDRIIALQEKKRQLIGDALDEKASQSIARLSAQDLAYLFGVTGQGGQQRQR